MTVPIQLHMRLRIIVVGGGFTGAAFILHAIRSLRGPLDFEVIEPAGEIGRGIAYGAADSRHRINVPSERMSLFPDDPLHAVRWLFDKDILPGDGASRDAAGHHYVPRRDYGAYVADTLRQALSETRGRVRLRHHRTQAQDVCRQGARWSVKLADGEAITGDYVILSFGHAAPRAPFPVSAEAAADPRLVTDPWRNNALAGLSRDASLLLVGTGLTMVDMVETLLSRGHQGGITLVSRHGLLPRPHGLFGVSVDLLQGGAAPSSALALLRLVRRQVREAVRQGLGWQPVADAVRFDLGNIWPALPVAEQRRVIKRLLPYWDVHRFRISPQACATLERAIWTGRVVLQKAAVLSVEAESRSLVATLRRGGTVERRPFDGVVLCIGPDKDLNRNPLARNLLASGLARSDALHFGLDVDRHSRLVADDGHAHATLLALGPMTRGTFGEMTGAPDIVRQIVIVTRSMADSVAMQASA
ncbi:FAD/NAD(P)-binding protein [Taklimakanibacter deserti]|uniref:FAD/NAD(P)-binding protein n=1 Tax=Taklimakanibacter deserti TaxID=2267839 RepID=UPI0034D71A54